MKKFGRIMVVGKTSAVALVSTALVFAVASASTQSSTRVIPGTSFTITSVISSSATNLIPALMYPGAQRYLWYTAHNTQRVPITVTSLGIRSVTAPSGCSVTNLDYSGTTFSGSLIVPAMGTNAVAVPISLVETHTNQDTCENKVFNFTYSGSAKYTEVYVTATTVTSSLNPSKVGQSVTYTATVTASTAANQHPVPGSPTGTITFKDGATTICNSVAVLSTGATTSTATCSPPAYAAPGIHPITAVYVNTDGSFSSSISSVLSQVVQPSHIATTTSLASAPNPSGLGSPVTLTASVRGPSGSATPTGTVGFYSGSPSGTHTLLGTATLNASGKTMLTTSSLPAGTDSLYAVYSGDTVFLTSTSPVISQVVIVPPGKCDGNYRNWLMGQPGSPVIDGSKGNYFLYAFGGNYRVHGFDGDNCFYVGDGNNIFNCGNGNDVLQAGNGNNDITFGNGDDKITVGDGVNGITLGNGNDTVTVGDGSSNNVSLGSGSDVVTIQGGGHDTINGGNGHETIYLGAGSHNTFNGALHHTSVCYLPAPPSSWHGTAAAYYHDTITNCTVATA